MGELFPTLVADNRLKADEVELLRALPSYPTTEAMGECCYPAARRLETKGLIKVHREKDDPIATRPTWYAGVTETGLRALQQQPGGEG